MPLEVKIEKTTEGIFVVADDVRIAYRGHPHTPEADTWVSLVPGWQVKDAGDHLAIHYDEVTLY